MMSTYIHLGHSPIAIAAKSARGTFPAFISLPFWPRLFSNKTHLGHSPIAIAAKSARGTFPAFISLPFWPRLFSNNTMSFTDGVHAVAARGFNLDSKVYESARPSYPAAAVVHLQTQLGLVPFESHVLDLGAGSGKFTRLLLPQNYYLTGVEPSPSMRAVFSEVLPTVPIQDGTATSIPVQDGSQDAVVVAQAFHWFANLNVLKEIHRVLKPGGRLGLIWNLEDRSSTKWVASLRDLYEKYEMNTPQYRLGLWKQVWGTEQAKELFSELQEAHFENVQLCSEEMVLERVASKSYIACLSAEEKVILREQLLSTFRAAADVERDPATGLVKYPYQTDFHWCEKLVK